MARVKICFGGSFDPVHNGHIGIAKALASHFGHPVSLLPNYRPAHRKALIASPEHRYAMLRLACDGDVDLDVDDMELRRKGLSYSLDTLAAQRQKLGDEAILIWCVGMDAFAQLHTWSRWQQLLDYGHLLIIKRPRCPMPDAPQLLNWWQNHRVDTAQQLLLSTKGGIATITLPQFDISATEIRRSLCEGYKSKKLPAAVANYIAQHKLYLHDRA